MEIGIKQIKLLSIVGQTITVEHQIINPFSAYIDGNEITVFYRYFDNDPRFITKYDFYVMETGIFTEEYKATNGITTVIYNNMPLHVCYKEQIRSENSLL
ncbi:hypothetical protein [Paenibacillus sp. FSL R5-0914]|uniref:hypothetical protein n=1 Tax=Paenibacillus sp. FSL R5-0914 TaxID=2921665 RepID=UPI0030F570D7